MADGNGIPLLGDRSAFDTVNYPEKHAADIATEAYTVHLMPPGDNGQVPTSQDGAWVLGTPSGGAGVDILAVQVFS